VIVLSRQQTLILDRLVHVKGSYLFKKSNDGVIVWSDTHVKADGRSVRSLVSRGLIRICHLKSVPRIKYRITPVGRKVSQTCIIRSRTLSKK